MPYIQERSVEKFIAPLFIREDGYWENHMLPYLAAEGWSVIIIDCAGITSCMDFARRLVTTIDPYYTFPDNFNLRWASEESCLIRDRDMRQGLFVLYKNFDDFFALNDDDITACVNILEEMDRYYSIRPIHGSGLYQVLFGWGFEFSQENLPRVKEFFKDHALIAADGADYPWSIMERYKKIFFPHGFPDPLYEDGTDWNDEPDDYPESTSYAGTLYPIHRTKVSSRSSSPSTTKTS